MKKKGKSMRTRFDEQLAEMNQSLLEMSAQVEKAIALAIKALMLRDEKLAKEVIEQDGVIDTMERNIASQCLKLILHQQPIARDLRVISTALKMITDLERIGDHATDISEITLLLIRSGSGRSPEELAEMAKETVKMVSDSILAFVGKDEKLAAKVIKQDDTVDDLFSAIRQRLIALIRGKEENGEDVIDFLMIAKYFERIGDHAVNIAEWVIFSITGQHKDIKII